MMDAFVVGLILWMLTILTLSASGAETNAVSGANASTTWNVASSNNVHGALLAHSPASSVPEPGVAASVFRMLGSLVMVMGLFFAGVWVYRRWQLVSAGKSGQTHLHVLEVRSLGARQSLYVVGYDRQRLLLASSPNGVQLISHLPEAEQEASRETVPLPSTFAAALQSVVTRKP